MLNEETWMLREGTDEGERDMEGEWEGGGREKGKGRWEERGRWGMGKGEDNRVEKWVVVRIIKTSARTCRWQSTKAKRDCRRE